MANFSKPMRILSTAGLAWGAAAACRWKWCLAPLGGGRNVPGKIGAWHNIINLRGKKPAAKQPIIKQGGQNDGERGIPTLEGIRGA
ncbi:MAG: hypothetical protein LBU00_04730, partial [Treponema sp.]|nr:hypothetical protein [Treponema sp.]